MIKNYVFFIMVVALVSMGVNAQNDSLKGFDMKEMNHHLEHFKGTLAERNALIAKSQRAFINRKYKLGAYDIPKLVREVNERWNQNPNSQSLSCNNIGFDDGTTTGWTMGGSTSPFATTSTTTGDNFITSGTGVDPYGHYPVVYSGTNSLLMSDSVNTSGNYTSSAMRVIAVSPSNAYLNLHYAIDILDFPHTQSTAAYFMVNFYDATGNLIPCSSDTSYYYDNGTGTGVNVGLPNVQTTSCPGNCGVNIGGQPYPVSYQNWHTLTADLTPYTGANVTCVITCSWCLYSYDWAYCYIDADCGSSGGSSSQITQLNPLCAGGSTILQGPPGMTTYSWTGPVTGTTQNLVTSTPGNYTLTTTASGSCFSSVPTLYYTLTATTTAAPVVSIVASNDSVCSGATTTLTASGANTYTWCTGANMNIIAVSPPTNATYTVIGTNTTTGCAGSATQAIFIFGGGGGVSITTANNPICTGTTATLTASGASTYTWSSNAGGVHTNTVAVSPTSNTTYTVTGTDIIHGCIIRATQLISMATNISLTNPNDSICNGNSVTLTASGAASYTWSTGATGASIAVTPTVTTSYTVTGAVACINTATTTIKVLPTPTVTASATSACEGVPVVISASGANTYIWNTGSSASSITVTPTVTTIYTVTGTAVNTCKNIASATVVVPLNPAPMICEVTTDSISNYQNNVIIWDNSSYVNVDSFIIYRFNVISNSYLRIGAVSKYSVSEFKDTAFSIGGPNGGNPLYSSWKYTLAVLDTCGNISAQSPFHQTMFVQESGANFSWNAYTIGAGQTNPVTGYSFLRDDNSTGNWHVLVNTAGISATDPNYSSYPNANYRVDAVGFSCAAPIYRLVGANSTYSGSYGKSHSNTLKPVTVGIERLSAINSQISIYPNPNNGSFVVEPNTNAKQTIVLYDVTGKMVLTQVINGKTSIDASGLSEGVYNLSIVGIAGVVNKKLVIVR